MNIPAVAVDEVRERRLARQRAWHRTNRERHNANARAWKKAHPEYWAAYRAKNHDRLREQERARRAQHGTRMISRAAFLILLETQGGGCAICREPVPPSAHVDHDHVSKRVRGILCRGCNVGLGHFGDSPERLLAAARYLVEHK